ncbi:MAG: Fic family protein [bacterium]
MKTTDLKTRLNKRLELTGKFAGIIPQMISTIDQLNLKWQYEKHPAPEYFDKLEKTAIITSAGASNRIENIILTDDEVAVLFAGLNVKNHTTRDELEVAGYLDLLNQIFENYKNIKFSLNTILGFHSQMYKYSKYDENHRGKLKMIHNKIVAKDADGNGIAILHNPTEPYLVAIEINELLRWTNESLQSKNYHQLLVIANFVIEFLAIHPFLDGNGRMSRILTVFLLLKEGYEFAKYSSHEKIIEETKAGYYLALRKGQAKWKTQNEDIQIWLEYFLGIVEKQGLHALALARKVEINKVLSEKQNLIYKALQRNQLLSRREIVKITQINVETVKQAVNKLVKLNLIERIGEGRATRYRILNA